MVRGPSAGNLRFLPLVLALFCTGAAQPARPSHRPSATVVSAFVWDAVNAPVPNMTVALRNLATARIDRTQNSDENGHVSFRGVDRGMYVLEVADTRGVVVATGQTFSIDEGESVATFVRLTGRSPWYSGLFNNVGAIAVATAAGLGATAVGASGQPQSPGR
jgi:hypothetical protein